MLYPWVGWRPWVAQTVSILRSKRIRESIGVLQATAKSVMGAVRKLRRSRNGKPTPSHLPIVKVEGRPTVVFAPTDLSSTQRVPESFDTQAWIDEFGTTAYLFIPREEFIDRPRRSRFAYRSYSPSQRPAVLALADIVITDRPELIR